jgi:predicted nucleic acid-binding Zn ribbon protein
MAKETHCKVCSGKVEVMARKGTDLCSQRCEDAPEKTTKRKKGTSGQRKSKQG